MITKNKIDKAFGPFGTSAGYLLFLVGLGTIYFSYIGLILVVFGAFIGFTSTSTSIDYEQKRLRFSNNIFGIFPIGPWVSIQKDMKIGIKTSDKKWRLYSQSNSTLDIEDHDYRIILYDFSDKEMMPLQKCDNQEAAKLNLEKLSQQLGIGIIINPSPKD